MSSKHEKVCDGLTLRILGADEEEAGYRAIVDSEKRSRALTLYRRLGYVPLSETPVEDKWEFTDSDGVKHEGREWLIFLRKAFFF